MKKISNLMLLLAALLVAFTSCQKEDDAANPSSIPVELTFSAADLSNARTTTKEYHFGECDNLIDLEHLENYKVCLGLTFTDKVFELEIDRVNGDKYSLKGLDLAPGNYDISLFIVKEKQGDGTYEPIMLLPLGDSPYADFVQNDLNFDVFERGKNHLNLEVLCLGEEDVLSNYGYIFFHFEPIPIKRIYFFTNYCDENNKHQVAGMKGIVKRKCDGEIIYVDKVFSKPVGNGGSQLVDKWGNPDFLCLPVHDGCDEGFEIWIYTYPVMEGYVGSDNSFSEAYSQVEPLESYHIDLTYEEVCKVRDRQATDLRDKFKEAFGMDVNYFPNSDNIGVVHVNPDACDEGELGTCEGEPICLLEATRGTVEACDYNVKCEGNDADHLLTILNFKDQGNLNFIAYKGDNECGVTVTKKTEMIYDREVTFKIIEGYVKEKDNKVDGIFAFRMKLKLIDSDYKKLELSCYLPQPYEDWDRYKLVETTLKSDSKEFIITEDPYSKFLCGAGASNKIGIVSDTNYNKYWAYGISGWFKWSLTTRYGTSEGRGDVNAIMKDCNGLITVPINHNPE
ncbi:hypothetical protein V6R21_12585 [Limibacter armeniacum]|uniref:hypothetical protein n=1 Tax=Limibacter armeniacum TaxID=466084 RepID=UPI002FE66418